MADLNIVKRRSTFYQGGQDRAASRSILYYRAQIMQQVVQAWTREVKTKLQVGKSCAKEVKTELQVGNFFTMEVKTKLHVGRGSNMNEAGQEQGSSRFSCQSCKIYM